MSEPMFFVLHFIGTVAACTALITVVQIVLYPQSYLNWARKADGWPHAFPDYKREYMVKRAPPFWHPTRLLHVIRFALSFIGAGYLLYGAMLQVFSWIPYSWRFPVDGDTIWAAYYVAGVMAIHLLFGLWILCERIINNATDNDSNRGNR